MTRAGVLWFSSVRLWSNRAAGSRLPLAIFTVGVATVAVKGGAMLKDMVVAYRFGAGDAMDAYLIALLLPMYAVNVVSGSLPAALIPVYARVRQDGSLDHEREFLGSVFAANLLLTGAATLLLGLVSPYILPAIGANFGGAKLALTRDLFLLLLPGIIFTGFSRVSASVLNTGQRFLLAALTPLLPSILAVAAILLLPQAWGIFALATGTLFGYMTEAAVLGWALRGCGLHIWPRWGRWSAEVRAVMAEYVPALLGTAAMSSSPLIDQSMAASLGAGSVATLGYGNKLIAAGVGIAVTALSTAIFPHFSMLIATHDWISVRRTLRVYGRGVFLAAVPVTLLLVLFAEPIVRAVFQRGAFSASDTVRVARVQMILALQIPFYIVGIVGVRLLSAMGGNRIVMTISLFNIALNIAANYLFMQLWDVRGIAMSTSLVYAVSCTAIFVSVYKRLELRVGVTA